MKRFLHWLEGRGEEGQTMVEYAIVAALIAVVAMIAVETLGTSVAGVFDSITEQITSI